MDDSIRGRSMPSRKKDAMNTAIAIAPITAPNQIPIRDAKLRRGVGSGATSVKDGENCDSIVHHQSDEILDEITIRPLAAYRKDPRNLNAMT
jgi:hypothetical protein